MSNRFFFLLMLCITLCVLVPTNGISADVAPSTVTGPTVAGPTATGPTVTGPTQASTNTPVAIVALHGEVNDYTKGLLERQINQARQAGAKTIIIDMDTFGGLITSALEITHFIRGQSDLHIIAYVNKAYSAGAMISVSCNEIVMAPDAAIGDCAPIEIQTDGSLNPLQPTERAKAHSPVLTDFDTSADHAGYNRYLLEGMVVFPHIVYWMQDPQSHEKRFVNQPDHDELIKKGWAPVAGIRDPINGPDTLLTVQANDAVKLGLASGISPSSESLASQHGKLVANLTPGSGEKIIEFLNLDVVHGVLMTVLIMTLGIIFASPGHGLAESVAVICLGLLLGVPLLTGYAQWWEIIIIFGGLALLAFEIFVFPGHGVSAALGIAMIVIGLLLTFIGPQPGGGILPDNDGSWLNLKHGAIAMASSVFASIFLMLWLQKYLPKLPFFNRLILATPTGSEPVRSASSILPENTWPGVGTAGIAVTDLRPGGSAEFLDLAVGDNRPIAVISESGYVAAGSKLVVRESKGNRVVVSPVQA